MSGRLTRRGLLASAAALAGQAAWARAPLESLFPVPRPDGTRLPDPSRPRDVLAEVALPGQSAFVVADAATGEVLDAANANLPLPSASVAKAITAEYALRRLGPDHVFRTRILTTAPIVNGRLDGDIALVGGGDPMLDSEDLGSMAEALFALGLREVTGRFLVHGGTLPTIRQIDPLQLDHVAYNPSVAGLNLNFNRIYFEWVKEGDDYTASLDARAGSYQPAVSMARMEIVERPGPVFTYELGSGREQWTVARGALGSGGAQWLPVRLPELYAAQAFHSIARASGIRMPAPVLSAGMPEGVTLHAHESLPLDRIVRSMLYFSTNHIAEVIGLAASVADGREPRTLSDSATAMNTWMREELGASWPWFVDHSGLGDKTRVSAADLVAALTVIGPDSLLAELMRKAPVPQKAGAIEVKAKTGTLHFVSSLAGFVRLGERDLVFAILAADLERRDAITDLERQRPRGARGWANRARYQEGELLAEWAARFG